MLDVGLNNTFPDRINSHFQVSDPGPEGLLFFLMKQKVVLLKCLMSLSGHLLRPIGMGPPCFPFIRYVVVLCL